jgi:hypothetical protein
MWTGLSVYLKLQVGRVRVACPASAKAATDVAGLSRAHAAARMAPFDFAGFHTEKTVKPVPLLLPSVLGIG